MVEVLNFWSVNMLGDLDIFTYIASDFGHSKQLNAKFCLNRK